MCPTRVGKSHSTLALQTGEAKFWVLLIGISQYDDNSFAKLPYSALDCQKLGDAIAIATQTFVHKTVLLHHDAAPIERPIMRSPSPLHHLDAVNPSDFETVVASGTLPAPPPKRSAIHHSLQQIVAQANPQDTVLFYFSGHSLLDSEHQQPVLCLADTDHATPTLTGLLVTDLLHQLSQCRAQQQMVWLDACPGNGVPMPTAQNHPQPHTQSNLISQIIKLLRQQAVQRSGFSALLSCDHDQQSWASPELGHGVFTYYLIRGLLGDAADEQGIIAADALFTYVYNQMLQYIEQTNQRLQRLVPQRQGHEGMPSSTHSFVQTPRRFGKGMDNLVLGLSADVATDQPHDAVNFETQNSPTPLQHNPPLPTVERLVRPSSNSNEHIRRRTTNNEPSHSFESLNQAIASSLSSIETTPDQCPYLGLRSFSEADAPFFFGRKGLVQRLLNVVKQEPFLAVVGAAGSGKSSLVQAGLVAQLRQGIQIPGSDTWRIATFKPGTDPLQALARCLVDETAEHPPIHSVGWISNLLALGAESVVSWLRSRREPMLMLIIDQFEELFTQTPASLRQRFLDLVTAILEQASDRVTLVITLRNDFIPACLEHSSLAQRLQRSSVLVPPMLASDDYRQIITQPAKAVGLEVEPKLVTTLLHELSQINGGLPLLEFALEKLWQQHSQSFTLKQYQQSIEHLQVVLERTAQSVYKSLDYHAQLCVRWLFLSLIQLNDKTEPTLRRVFKADLVSATFPPDLVERSLQAFVDAKLLVISQDAIAHPQDWDTADYSQLHTVFETATATELITDNIPQLINEQEPMQYQDVVAVAHESLIRYWPTLRQWVEEHHARLPIQQQIEQAAQEWRLSGQLPDFLLRGVHLEEAAKLYKHYANELPEDVREFVEAGLEQHQWEQQQTQRRLSQTRLAIALIGGLGIFAASVGGFTFLKQQAARLSDIRALNTLSESQLQAHQQLESLLTSLNAVNMLQHTPWLGIRPATFSVINAQTVATLEQAVQHTEELNRLDGHAQGVNTVSVNPDDGAIATGGDDAVVRIWSPNGQLQYQLQEDGSVTSVAFSPDGLSLAVATAKGSLSVWNPTDGEKTVTVTESGDPITQVVWSTGGQLLATSNQAATVRLWDAANGKALTTLMGHTGEVNSVTFGPNGQIMASGGEDNTVRIWDAATGRLRQILASGGDRVTQVSIHPDGNQVAAANGDGSIYLWNLSDATSTVLSGHRAAVNTVSFSPDGEFLASGDANGVIILWSTTSGQRVQTIRGHSSAITDVTFSADGQHILSTSADKTVRIWQAEQTVPSHPGTVAIALLPDGQRYVTANHDGTLQIWRLTNAKTNILLDTIQAYDEPLAAIAIAPEGQWMASGGEDPTIKLWNLKTGQLMRSLPGHTAKVTSLAVSRDGQTLASSSEDGTVRLWNVKDGALLQTFAEHQDGVSQVAFSPKDNLLASASYDKTIKLWDLKTGQLTYTLADHDASVGAIAFSPDGQLLASGSWDHTIKLWRVKTGIRAYTLSGHQDGITSLTFSPNGQFVVSGSADHSLRFWNATNGTLIKTLMGSPDSVRSIHFSPDGQRLFSASESHGIVTWMLDPAQLIKTGCDRIQNYLSNASQLPSEYITVRRFCDNKK